LQPDNPDVLDNLGYIASQRGENSEAEAFLRRAIALGPESFPAYHDLGRLLVKLKRYDEAVPLLRRGVELKFKRSWCSLPAVPCLLSFEEDG
jgi:tetratricopeptide (TPR) repeat protein